MTWRPSGLQLEGEKCGGRQAGKSLQPRVARLEAGSGGKEAEAGGSGVVAGSDGAFEGRRGMTQLVCDRQLCG